MECKFDGFISEVISARSRILDEIPTYLQLLLIVRKVDAILAESANFSGRIVCGVSLLKRFIYKSTSGTLREILSFFGFNSLLILI